ncbi:MAG: hypothetical protein AVDCRST_MAG27-639, partial [uncultured Craurococcus sp.]
DQGGGSPAAPPAPQPRRRADRLAARGGRPREPGGPAAWPGADRRCDSRLAGPGPAARRAGRALRARAGRYRPDPQRSRPRRPRRREAL